MTGPECDIYVSLHLRIAVVPHGTYGSVMYLGRRPDLQVLHRMRKLEPDYWRWLRDNHRATEAEFDRLRWFVATMAPWLRMAPFVAEGYDPFRWTE